MGRLGHGPTPPGRLLRHPLNTPHAIKAGPNGCRSLLISSPAGFAELIGRAATPAHLAGLDADGCARPRHEPDLRPFLVELPGIEPATKIKLTCRNADSGYAKVREQLLMQLTRQVFTELAEATALWWDVTERRDPDDARRATRQIIAVYRKHQAIITAVNELASYDSVVAEKLQGDVRRHQREG